MTPGSGHKTNIRARGSVKGRDSMPARFLVRIGIRKDPQVLPNTPLGGRATPWLHKAEMITTSSSSSSMSTCMHRVMTRPQCGMEGVVDM